MRGAGSKNGDVARRAAHENSWNRRGAVRVQSGRVGGWRAADAVLEISRRRADVVK
jgi:hypothetical protein